jgi:hypothetical protein
MALVTGIVNRMSFRRGEGWVYRAMIGRTPAAASSEALPGTRHMKSGNTFASVGYLLGRRSRRTAGAPLVVFSGSFLLLFFMFLVGCLPRRRRRIAHCLARSKSRYRHGSCEHECKEQCSQLFHRCTSYRLVCTQLHPHLKCRIIIRLGTTFNCNKKGIAMTVGS